MRRIILFSILIAVLAAFFASSYPDGLEKVAERLGFIEKGIERTSLMTDYAVSFIPQASISTSLAGIAGIFLVFGLFYGVGKILAKRFYS